MKPSVFLLCILALLAATGQAAPRAAAPSASTAAMPMSCMQGGKMPATCPCMQGAACPAMQGGGMAPGMMGNGACPGRGKGPCPGMRGNAAAPAASGKATVAGTSNPGVYGWNLMSHEERVAYRTKIRAAKTATERAAICSEHNQAMTERAKQQGVSLPPAPAC